MVRKLIAALIVVAAVGGAAYFGLVTKADVSHAFDYLKNAAAGKGEHDDELSHKQEVAPAVSAEWDRLAEVDEVQRKAIGLDTVKVREQTEPIKLELLGTTGYDESTLVRIRPRFDTLVQKVSVVSGGIVKKGDPLVDLYSNDLSKAKNDYRVAYLQWVLKDRLYRTRKELVKTGAVSQLLWVETQNDENTARLNRDLAANKLYVYGITDEVVASLVEGLSEENFKDIKAKDVAALASMTLKSPTDGIVISRDVVPGNLYDETSTLLTIAPLDHLYVWGNVYESDQSKVDVGQTWEIHFPFLAEKVKGKVEYVSNRVDPETHAIRIRASIPNPDGRFKADNMVRAILEIPPVAGQTVVPRQAVVTIHGQYFVFVARSPSKFERRAIRPAQENSDTVIVASGLDKGEEIVSRGSLLVEQIYEDQSTIHGLIED
jgi:cobalt-zinc-cadmium efflux system membrane fusion protein